MARKLLQFMVLISMVMLLSMRSPVKWIKLLDKDLTQWERYLSYKHSINYNGNTPTDVAGKAIQPIGYNTDPENVFSILHEPSGPVLRVSGETYGCLFTRQSFKNYHLTLQVKWGEKKYAPRQNQLRELGFSDRAGTW